MLRALQQLRREGLMRRLAVLALLVASLGGLGSATVSAASPLVLHDRSSVETSYIDTSLCAFPVAVSSSANIDDALFFDQSGGLVRILETVDHVVFIFSANGQTLTAKGTGGIDIVFNPDGSVSASTFGINLLLTIPTYGAVFLDAGRAEYLFDPHIHVLFHAGPASYDVEAFCAALA
jgi:hypothetical protein